MPPQSQAGTHIHTFLNVCVVVVYCQQRPGILSLQYLPISVSATPQTPSQLPRRLRAHSLKACAIAACAIAADQL